MENTEKQITEIIRRAKKETIFFTEDFRETGSAEAVKVALHRLVKRNAIQRLARGIYARPEFSPLLGKEVFPDFQEVAKAVARRDRARIIPTGSYALNALGLSQQVPMKVVYLTDGSPRVLTIGKAKVTFKKTTPRNLSFLSELSMLVVQALKEIGQGKVTDEEKAKIIDLLRREEYQKLKHDISIAPQWIAEIMSEALPK